MLLRTLFALSLFAATVFAGRFLEERSTGPSVHVDNKGNDQDLYCSACMIFFSTMMHHMNQTSQFSETTRFTSKLRKKIFQDAADKAVETLKSGDFSLTWTGQDGRHFINRLNPNERFEVLKANVNEANHALFLSFMTSFHKRQHLLYEKTANSSSIAKTTRNWMSLACRDTVKACMSASEFMVINE